MTPSPSPVSETIEKLCEAAERNLASGTKNLGPDVEDLIAALRSEHAARVKAEASISTWQDWYATAYRQRNAAKAKAERMREALRETRTDLSILRGNIADAEKTQPRWKGMPDEVGKWIARIEAALQAQEGRDAG